MAQVALDVKISDELLQRFILTKKWNHPLINKSGMLEEVLNIDKGITGD